MADSALQKAMSGQDLSDRQTKGALSEALDKLSREGGKLSKLKEHVGELSEALIYSGELQGTVFVSSFAEGYLGEEKMDIGPVDLRLAGGVLTSGYGFYNVMMGKGGEHALAVGNGLLATGIGRVGRNAGKALAEKKDKGKAQKGAEGASADQAAGAPATPAPADRKQIQETPPNGDGVTADGDFGAFVRDIFLTPDGESTEGRHNGRAERSKPSRFIRATVSR